MAGIILRNFKTDYKGINSVVLAKEQTYKQMEHNREPRKDPHNYPQQKTVQLEEENLFNKRCCNN